VCITVMAIMSSLNQGVHIMWLTVAKGLWTTLFQSLGDSLKATFDKLAEFYSCIKNMREKAGVWLLNMCTTQNLESLSSGPPIFCTCKTSGKAADYMYKPYIVIEAVKKLSGKEKLSQYWHPYNNYITFTILNKLLLLYIIIIFVVYGF